MPQVKAPNKTADKLPHFRSIALVALGSNQLSRLGDATETLTEAKKRLLREIGTNHLSSRFFSTPAFPPGSGPDFVNAAVAFDCDLEPQYLMEALHDIEADMGRVRTNRWGQRTLDMDLLAFGSMVLPDLATFEQWRKLPLERQMTEAPQQLILPHPRLQDRAFVLVPLADVAPDWVHPVLGRTVLEMLSDLPSGALDGIVAL